MSDSGSVVWRELLSFPVQLLLVCLLLLVPFGLRALAGDPLILGADSYAQLSLAPSLSAPYASLLHVLERFGDLRMLVSFALGVVSFALVAFIARRALRKEMQRALVCLLFAINPIFLGVFTSLTPFTFVVPLVLLVIAALQLQKRRALPALSLAIALFSFYTALIMLLALLALRRHLRTVAIVSLLVCTPVVLLAGVPFAEQPHAFSLHIAEFGMPLGISFLFVALATFEGVLRWIERRGRAAIAMLFALFLLAPFSQAALIFAGLCSAPFAGLFLDRLLRRRWVLEEARVLTILLVTCSLLFLAISHIGILRSQEPTRSFVQTIAALPPGRDIVLAPPKLGPIVEGMSGHPALLGADSCLAREQVCADADALYHSSRLEDAQAVLKSRNITYLLITKEMRDGVVWNRDDEGLLFLLQHSDRFVRISSDPQHELYKYTSSQP